MEKTFLMMESDNKFKDQLFIENTQKQIREYRNLLVTVVSVFAFGIASTANGSPKQKCIADLGFAFTLLLASFLALAYREHFEVIQNIKKITDKIGVVTLEEYEDIVNARAFYKQCMTFRGKDSIGVIILAFSMCYLIFLM